MVQVDDRILVQAAQAGDMDAFEMLVRRYQTPVYRIALRLLGSSADADDVTQDAFLRAWRSLSRFRGDSVFATWLYRIVTHRCFDLLTAHRPTVVLDEEHLGTSADPSITLEQRERLRAITHQIQALAPDQRAALVLRELEGLSYTQVAEVLETTVPAVKGRIHRARLTLLTQTTAWQ